MCHGGSCVSWVPHAQVSGDVPRAPLGVAASSVLFGLAHWNFDVSVENAFLLTLQTFYGFCFALCYRSSMGRAPQLDVAGQVAYTRRSLVAQPEADAGDAVPERVREVAAENDLDEGFLTLTKTVFYYLDTNQDGYDDSKIVLRSFVCGLLTLAGSSFRRSVRLVLRGELRRVLRVFLDLLRSFSVLLSILHWRSCLRVSYNDNSPGSPSLSSPSLQ
ncbi:EF-hand domain-containing protein [Pseudoscourfieldia marina]